MDVVVFLDYANIEAGAVSNNYKIDYKKLLEYFAIPNYGRNLIAAYAYVPIDPRREHATDQIIQNLWNYGYLVRSKIGTIAGDSYKCDLDIELTMDMMKSALESHPDIVVLASGDSDFAPIVVELRERGIRVEVAAFRNTISRLLANRCSGVTILDESEVPQSENIADDNSFIPGCENSQDDQVQDFNLEDDEQDSDTQISIHQDSRNIPFADEHKSHRVFVN